MSLGHQLRYFEKQHLRPLFRHIRKMVPTIGGRPEIPAHLQARLESLESRLAELEQLVQEDLGLRLSESGTKTSESDGNS